MRFGWTLDERLVVLNEEGTYRVYDLQGDYVQFSIGPDASETGVLDARIHEGGMVVLTGALALLEIKGWDGSRPLTLASAGKPLLSYAVPLVNSARTLGTSTHLEHHTPRSDNITSYGSLNFTHHVDFHSLG